MPTRLRLLVVSMLLASSGCASSPAHEATAPTVRWLRPAEVVPHGSAPGARHRLLGSHEDGSKEYALILASGDEVWPALADFARAENVTAARFTAIGAVRDPEFGWFDPAQHKYKAMRLRDEQGEVLSLVGDIGLNPKGEPVVHTHVVFGRTDGGTFGGHLIGATTSPTLEVFITTFAQRLDKKANAQTGLQLFDLSPPAPATTGPRCGPVGAKCDSAAPPCVCPANEMCHGLVCSSGVWSEVEVFPAEPSK
jgi:uncharacterized protein